jgi:hypothetical protein
MARLTAKARSKIPTGKFAGPGRSFPIEDANHARAALIDVGRAKGLSPQQKQHIREKAKEALDRSHLE